jgi:hypothetical protein
MDNEKLKQFISPIMILFLIIACICYISPQLIEKLQAYHSATAEYSTKVTTLEQLNQNLADLKKKAEEEQVKETNSGDKPFYKPVMSGLDTEAVIAGEFAEILRLVRANQIKVRSIKYDYDPKDDAFVQNAGDKYNVARLNMEMISNYTNYDNFLKEMYKHSHFLDIQSVEIVPYKKDKKVLLINFRVKLYAKK